MKALFVSRKFPRAKNYQTKKLSTDIELKPFQKGFEFKGFEVQLYCPESLNTKIIEKFDIVVEWGYYKDIKDLCKSTGVQYLIAERAYLGRRLGPPYSFASLAAWGLNGRGVFSNIKNHSSDRRDKYFPNLFCDFTANYDPNGHIILAAQVPRDRSLVHVTDDIKNYSNIIKDISTRFPEKKIIFRQHPDIRKKKSNLTIPKNVVIELDENISITQTFKGAKALVTINSNSALLARIAGLEVYDYDIGSISYSVNKRINEEWWNNKKESRELIEQLCNNIAHYQYTIKEIEMGLPWDNISKVLSKNNFEKSIVY